MPWKQTNIDAGALAALLLGMLALGGTIVSVQSWVDDRIDQRVAPLELELSELREAMRSSDASRNRQYGEILGRFDRMLERLK